MSETTYREIPGFTGYRVGDDGTVWSRHFSDPYPRGRLRDEWKQLRASTVKGYLKVGMRRPGQSRVQVAIHRVVLEAFVGPCPEGMQCRHLDGDCLNNRLSNLCWGTCRENSDDRGRHGTRAKGERIGNAKLTEAIVRAIRADRLAGAGYQELVAKYHVGMSQIGRIIRREQWEHLLT